MFKSVRRNRSRDEELAFRELRGAVGLGKLNEIGLTYLDFLSKLLPFEGEIEPDRQQYYPMIEGYTRYD